MEMGEQAVPTEALRGSKGQPGEWLFASEHNLASSVELEMREMLRLSTVRSTAAKMRPLFSSSSWLYPGQETHITMPHFASSISVALSNAVALVNGRDMLIVRVDATLPLPASVLVRSISLLPRADQ